MHDVSPALATPAGSRPSGATRRLRVTPRSLFDFWLDLVLLIAFVFDYSFQFTGLAWHEWIGLGFGLLVPVHLVQHWDWVVRTTRRLTHSRRGREALRWLVDLLLLPVMVLCVASGVLISQRALPRLGIGVPDGGFWRGLHTTFADVTVALVALHVALSWRWAWSIIRRITGRRTPTRSNPAGADPS